MVLRFSFNLSGIVPKRHQSPYSFLPTGEESTHNSARGSTFFLSSPFVCLISLSSAEAPTRIPKGNVKNSEKKKKPVSARDDGKREEALSPSLSPSHHLPRAFFSPLPSCLVSLLVAQRGVCGGERSHILISQAAGKPTSFPALYPFAPPSTGRKKCWERGCRKT